MLAGMARRWRTALAACILLAPPAGCQSERLITRTYKLHDPTAEAALIKSVLDEERAEHGERSASAVTEGGYAVVKATARGHSRVRAELDAARP
jgi:hypothetical protein